MQVSLAELRKKHGRYDVLTQHVPLAIAEFDA